MTIPEQEKHLSREQILQVLRFIGYPLKHPDHLPPPTMETLAELQYRCIVTIPFETLGLRMTKERHIDITLDGILDRVLNKKRGGWCLSNNRLAFELIRGLGFNAQWVLGRGCRPDNYGDPIEYKIPNHRVTIVRMDDGRKYVVDIGWGTSFYKPLELADGAEIEYFGHRRRMRVIVHPEENPALGNPNEYMWQVEECLGEERWVPIYAFLENQWYENDAEMVNWYLCHSPNSNFYSRFWCMRGTTDGKYYILISNKFKVRDAYGTKLERICKSEEERERILEEYFGIVVTEEERKWNDQKLGTVDGAIPPLKNYRFKQQYKCGFTLNKAKRNA
ncbi:N-terminal acetyltransferase [Actinomortierella wolfii]|nr:N-terminal acetyltransferase [Actinomortierella wolfii]